MIRGMPATRSCFRRFELRLLAAIALVATAAPLPPARAVENAKHCGPTFVDIDPTSGDLLILCGKSGTIRRLDPDGGSTKSEAVLGESPFAFDRHPDGARLYVTCRRGQEIRELDAGSLQTLRTFPLRGDPTGVAASADGRRLYVAVHSLDQVAIFDLETGREIKRVAAGNGPEMVRRSPQQQLIYVTNLLSNSVHVDQPPANEITVIDDISANVVERIILKNANVGRWIAFSPDGSLAVVAINRPKNLVPMVQVARGWVVTNGFAVMAPGSGHAPVQLLVDLPNQAYADPYGTVFTPDGRKFYLSCAGSDVVMAIDASETRRVMEDVWQGRLPRSADDLGLSRRYVVARIPVGANPQALAMSLDGRWLYVANRLDDSISVIDTGTDTVIRTLVMGTPPPPDKLARGERLFHSAARTFHGQFSCASCHPDEGLDGLQYDLEPDGLGQNLVDNRTMRAIGDTAPFKWRGSNPDITTQCGERTAKWIVRTGWLSTSQVVELASFIRSIVPVVNPFRSSDGALTDAQLRGNALFERTAANDGKPLPEQSQCHFCHSGSAYTNHQAFDVGTRSSTDSDPEFDTAHLTNIFESSPYLHDGRAATLEEIWTKYNPEDRHGVSSDWTKQQLNDLVEYLKNL
jgi:YVTN family beta-propeller protein